MNHDDGDDENDVNDVNDDENDDDNENDDHHCPNSLPKFPDVPSCMWYVPAA